MFVARNVTEAHFVRGLLESHGLAVQVRGEDLHGLVGDLPSPEGSPSVWVLDDNQEVYARSVLAGLSQETRDSRASTWRCQRCGEWLEAQFTTCWACGSERSSQSED